MSIKIAIASLMGLGAILSLPAAALAYTAEPAFVEGNTGSHFADPDEALEQSSQLAQDGHDNAAAAQEGPAYQVSPSGHYFTSTGSSGGASGPGWGAFSSVPDQLPQR